MGVDVRFEDLNPTEHDGSTFARHERLADVMCDRSIAIDASQWVFHAFQGARSRNSQDNAGDKASFQEVIRLSAVTLICDRVSQILRYGGHPIVILDGPPPIHKARVTGWNGNGIFGVNTLLSQLCKAMDVCCIQAPGEGEAFCAALNECGVADSCFSSDIIDNFYFGANTVMRSTTKSDQAHAKFITHTDPQASALAIVDIDKMMDYIGTEEQAEDALVFFAALVGTDYNLKGLPTFGKEKAKAVTRFICKEWQRMSDSGEEDGDFLDFAQRVVSGEVVLQTSDKSFQTFLTKATEEIRPGETFLHDLMLVIGVVQDQRFRAQKRAKQLSRADVEWTGLNLDHRALIAVLEKAKVIEPEAKVNGVLSRVMRLEAERMLRLGESTACKPLLRIDSIAKPKEIKKWQVHKGSDSESGGPQFYQYLVNVLINVDCDILDHSTKVKLVKYATEEKTWKAGARAARKSAIIATWPEMLAAYEQMCKGKCKKKASNARAVPGSVGSADCSLSAEKKRTGTEQRGLGTVNEIRTVADTYDVRSFLVSKAFPCQTTLDVITEHQPHKPQGRRAQTPVRHTPDVNHRASPHNDIGAAHDADSPVLPEKMKMADCSEPYLAEAVLHASPDACINFLRPEDPQALKRTSHDHVKPVTTSPPKPPCRSKPPRRSKPLQVPILFADKPDVISKQPGVCLEHTPQKSGHGLGACALRTPEKRGRKSRTASCATALSAALADPAASAGAIDLTFSSDDECPAQGSSHDLVEGARDLPGAHLTPTKRIAFTLTDADSPTQA